MYLTISVMQPDGQNDAVKRHPPAKEIPIGVGSPLLPGGQSLHDLNTEEVERQGNDDHQTYYCDGSPETQTEKPA